MTIEFLEARDCITVPNSQPDRVCMRARFKPPEDNPLPEIIGVWRIMPLTWEIARAK